MKKEEVIKEVVEMGGDITGNIGGAVLGALVAGPIGLAIGGVSGVVMTKIFKKIGDEIRTRVLSSREILRVGAVYTFAINKINQNEKDGKMLRKDDFFSERKDDRSFSEEILEGVILTAQREHQERKVKFLGNLYANICTDDSISLDQSNQLIKITNSITYRQFCLLALYYSRHHQFKSGNVKLKNLEENKNVPFDIVAEVKDLIQKGLLHTVTTFSSIDDFKCDRMNITSGGKFYYNLLELNEIESKELQQLNKLVNIV